MATNPQIDAVGIERILARFNAYSQNLKVPFYSVWQGRDLRFPYVGDSLEEGAAVLEANLAAMAPFASTNVFRLVFHPALSDDGFITNKSPEVGSFNFRINDTASFFPASATTGSTTVPVPGPGMDPMFFHLLMKMSERLDAIDERPYIDDHEESEPVDPTAQVIAGINDLTANPAISGLLNGATLLLMNLAENFSNKKNMNFFSKQPAAVTPSATQEEANNAIAELVTNVPDFFDILVKFNKLRIANPIMFAQATALIRNVS